jgi:hypothetical protein
VGDVHRHDDAEHWNPASGRNPHRCGDSASEDRADALSDIEEAIVCCGVPASERVGESRGEQRENLAPAEGDKTRKRDKGQRVLSGDEQEQNRRRLQPEGEPIVFSRPIRSDTQPKKSRVRWPDW